MPAQNRNPYDALWFPPQRPQLQLHPVIRQMQQLHLAQFQQPVAVMWRKDIAEIHCFYCPNRLPHYEWWVPEAWFQQSDGPGPEQIPALFHSGHLPEIYRQLRLKAVPGLLTGSRKSYHLEQICSEESVKRKRPEKRVLSEDLSFITDLHAPATFALAQMSQMQMEINLTRNRLIRYLQDIHLSQHGEPLAVLIRSSSSGSMGANYILNRFPRCEWQIGWDLAELMLFEPDYMETFVFTFRKHMGMFMQNYTRLKEKALPNALCGGGGYTVFDPIFE